ncbi:MAG: hypothetical protein H6707_16035 [Deltaproteobacteria bacterium]|nr:hypothetical protein [Deltaproteobacteria bacterium]
MEKENILRWAVLAVCCGIISACGPTLRGSADFSPQKVRSMLYDDVCKLQAYFDENTQPHNPETDFNIDSGGKAAVGKAAFKLTAKQREVFVALVKRLYKRTEKITPQATVRVVIPYHLRDQQRTMPIGANATIERTSGELRLPYHPCVGAFFFGERYYKLRKRLVMDSGDAQVLNEWER